MIMLVYMIGRNIPLYGVDVEAYRDVDINAQSIIIQGNISANHIYKHNHQ